MSSKTHSCAGAREKEAGRKHAPKTVVFEQGNLRRNKIEVYTINFLTISLASPWCVNICPHLSTLCNLIWGKSQHAIHFNSSQRINLFYEVLWKGCNSQISIVKICVHLFPGHHENLAMNGGSRTWRGLQGEPFCKSFNSAGGICTILWAKANAPFP